jgi:hypothetical protein
MEQRACCRLSTDLMGSFWKRYRPNGCLQCFEFIQEPHIQVPRPCFCRLVGSSSSSTPGSTRLSPACGRLPDHQNTSILQALLMKTVRGSRDSIHNSAVFTAVWDTIGRLNSGELGSVGSARERAPGSDGRRGSGSQRPSWNL